LSLDPQAPISSLGEDGLVELLRKRFPSPSGVVGIGDDAAVLPRSDERVVLATDTLVRDVDFDLRYFSGEDLGWKTLAVNLSDLAAMSARPTYAVVTLCLPPDTSVGFVAAVIDGLEGCAQTFGVHVVGGDISNSPVLSLGVTLLGIVQRPVLRSGAEVGDAVCVTNALGGSAGGLTLLREDPAARGPLVERHLRPLPRVAEGALLGAGGVTAMIDVSDGLVLDLFRLLSVSRRGCSVRSTSIPVDPGFPEGWDGLRAALFGGEDFELLFTAPQERVVDLRAALGTLGTAVTTIGRVTDGPPTIDEQPLEELLEETWDHLRNR
jgi:thiamine-monophosphate kinase